MRVVLISLCSTSRFWLARLRQVAAEAARDPRRMAGGARHPLVGVRQVAATCRRPSVLPSRCIVFARRAFSLNSALPGVMVSITCGTSHDRSSLVIERWIRRRVPRIGLEARPIERRVERQQVGAAAFRRRRTGRAQRPARRCGIVAVGATARGAMAIGARDLDGHARLAVELAVAVVVLLEVAVHALHAALEMNVLQVHRLAAALVPRRARRRRRALGGRRASRCSPPLRPAPPLDASFTGAPVRVDQVALAIALEHRAEQPAVPVEIRKLRLLERAVELRRCRSYAGTSGSDHSPRSALPSGLRFSIATRSRRRQRSAA